MKKRVLSLTLIIAFFINVCFIPQKVFAVEFDSQKLVDWLYKSESEMAKGVKAMLDGEEEPTYEIVKDLYLKLSTIYGMVNVSETVSSAVECLMNDISFFNNMVTGTIMIFDNWPAFNNSDYAMKNVVDGFQTGFGGMKMLGLSKYIPAGLSFACTTIELGISAGGILEKAYLAENLSFYVADLEIAFNTNQDIPLPNPPKITIGSAISQEEVDALYYAKYMEYSLKRIMSNYPNVQTPQDDETYKITFNSNCSTVDNYSYIYDINKGNWIDDYEMNRPGYIFMGWYWDKACTDSAMDETITIDRDLIFYAKWKQQYGYSISNGTATITDFLCYEVINGQTIKDLIVPSSIDGYTVTRIGDQAFYKNREISSIHIPDTVVYIGAYNFSYCDALQSIFFGSNVSDITIRSFFWGDDNLQAINVSEDNPKFSSENGVLFNKDKTRLIRCPYGKKGIYKIPNTVKSIDSNAFGSCKNLTSVIIPDTVQVIETSTFVCCEGIETIIIPDSVISIKENAFDRCKNLKQISLSNNLKSIGADAFSQCISLKEIVIPNSVTMLGEELFWDCSSLENVVLSENLSVIPLGLFDRCTSLKKLRIPDKVNIIEDMGLAGCFNLEEIILPKSLEKVGDWSFYIDDCLERIYYTGTQKEWNKIKFGEGSGVGAMLYFNYNQNNMPIVENIEEGKTVYVNCPDIPDDNAKIYLAVYNKFGKLLQMKSAAFAKNIGFNDVTDGVEYKVFIWKNFEPLCSPAEARRVYL